MKKLKELEISLATKHRFPNLKNLVNREIETVVLNTINPMNSKKLVTTFLMDFSFFTHRFFWKNLRNFVSQMGNAPGVYERMYGVQKAKSFFLRELLPASELATLHWWYCICYVILYQSWYCANIAEEMFKYTEISYKCNTNILKIMWEIFRILYKFYGHNSQILCCILNWQVNFV